MSRRKLLLLLSAAWLAAAGTGALLLSGAFGSLSDVAGLVILALVIGFAAFLVTGWVIEARDRFRPKTAQPASWDDEQTLDELAVMSPGEFEDWVKQLFGSVGYEVQDVVNHVAGVLGFRVVSPQGKPALVQCQRGRAVVGETVVSDLYDAVQEAGVALGMLVTTGSISDAAGRWVQDKPIELIDGSRLELLTSGKASLAELLARQRTEADA